MRAVGVDHAAQQVERSFDALAWRSFFSTPRPADVMEAFFATLEIRQREASAERDAREVS